MLAASLPVPGSRDRRSAPARAPGHRRHNRPATASAPLPLPPRHRFRAATVSAPLPLRPRHRFRAATASAPPPLPPRHRFRPATASAPPPLPPSHCFRPATVSTPPPFPRRYRFRPATAFASAPNSNPASFAHSSAPRFHSRSCRRSATCLWPSATSDRVRSSKAVRSARKSASNDSNTS